VFHLKNNSSTNHLLKVSTRKLSMIQVVTTVNKIRDSAQLLVGKKSKSKEKDKVRILMKEKAVLLLYLRLTLDLKE
jgi:hypothetical protein